MTERQTLKKERAIAGGRDKKRQEASTQAGVTSKFVATKVEPAPKKEEDKSRQEK